MRETGPEGITLSIINFAELTSASVIGGWVTRSISQSIGIFKSGLSNRAKNYCSVNWRKLANEHELTKVS